MVEVQHVGGEASSFRAVNHLKMEPVRGESTAQKGASQPPPTSNDTPSARNSGRTPTSGASTPGYRQSTNLDSTTQPAHETAATSEQPAQSQPMTATNSTSSNASTKDAGSSTAAAPYGTRSRNRPANTRPNYAEDVEMDFEMAPSTANGTISEPVSRGSLASENRQSPSVGGRKGGITNGSGFFSSTPTPKDLSIPGTSTFSANPNATAQHQPSKRRSKAAAKDAMAMTNGNSSNSASSQAVTKKSTANTTANNVRASSMLLFEKSKAILKNGKLIADDGTVLSVNDHVYLVCEPPGEPYYLCRIMEFLQTDSNKPNSPVDSLRVNWYYRPRDVGRYNNDTRLVYGTMHSDVCPITSLRGTCQILHRSEIEDLDEYRKQKDSFWFNQVFDRFIHRWYEAIPTSQVINVPEKVKRVLDERWKWVIVETSRVKELTSAVKTCKRCSGYCASNDSAECALCHNAYHMNCVRPPLLKKPSRGFAWACGPCSRAQERKLEARRTPLVGEAAAIEAEEEEFFDEEEEDQAVGTTAPSPSGSDAPIDDHPGTQAEIALAKMWPMRYLGIHCRVEDALQYDDRAIYPRASSRLGPRHQANVNVWHGRPVELVKPAEIKRRYVKSSSHKKDAKLSKETIAALEADRAEKAKRPKWVQDEPPGFVRRGDDHPNKDPKNTARLMFKMPPLGVYSSRGGDDSPTTTEEQVDAYMARARAFAGTLGLKDFNTNFLDRALQLFTDNNYDADAAFKQLKKTDVRKDLKEPQLTKEEQKRFEEGVAKYGSELRNVRLHVKTVSHADIVRYYYMWKKTPEGKKIWGSYGGRKGKNKKAEADPATKLLDDVADAQDDSAFDNDKAAQRKRGFQCKFCQTTHSRQWRRAPGVVPGQTVAADGRFGKDKNNQLLLALCLRCGNLWRKYAIKYENLEEIAKKVAQGGRAVKRRIDEELLREIFAANEAAVANSSGEVSGQETAALPAPEPAKKKQKVASDKDSDAHASSVEPVVKKKPAPQPKQPTPPPVPAQPKLRMLPCSICLQVDPTGDQHLMCKDCRLTVHRNCYGLEDVRPSKWTCDMCKNDKKIETSYTYECVLCPIKHTEQDLWEPPKVSHKKKTDREREKERLEKELVIKAAEEYRHAQRERGRPEMPREPLKRTSDNNWVHVYCAVWTPETKISDAKSLEVVEGIGAPSIRYDVPCKLCKTTRGACISCHQCHANFHVGCAHNAGYLFGFDITPVKGSRRDVVPTCTVGNETGSMTPVVFCKEHTPKTIVHAMNEIVDESGLNALQLYVRTYKQADLTLTGTARKANLVDQSTKMVMPQTVGAATNRRTSTAQTAASSNRTPRNSSAGLPSKNEEVDGDSRTDLSSVKAVRKCTACRTEISPKWFIEEDKQATDGLAGQAGAPADDSAPVNGVNGTDQDVVPTLERSQSHQGANGAVDRDHAMPDASSLPNGTALAPVVDGDVSVSRSNKWLCHKCHWKKKNAPELLDEPKRSVSQLQEPPHLPLRSPPTHSYPGASVPWMPVAATLPPHPSPITVGWPAHPPPLTNGIAHPPHVVAHIPAHHQPYAPPLHPHHQPNGYSPYAATSSLPPAQAVRSPYPPPSAPPLLHLTSTPLSGGLANGLHSPHIPLQSPTHPPVVSRSTESPYSGMPPHLPSYAQPHGSPVPGPLPPQNRPSTPRDVAPEPRPFQQGASASPSLRNLLH